MLFTSFSILVSGVTYSVILSFCYCYCLLWTIFFFIIDRSLIVRKQCSPTNVSHLANFMHSSYDFLFSPSSSEKKKKIWIFLPETGWESFWMKLKSSCQHDCIIVIQFCTPKIRFNSFLYISNRLRSKRSPYKMKWNQKLILFPRFLEQNSFGHGYFHVVSVFVGIFLSFHSFQFRVTIRNK